MASTESRLARMSRRAAITGAALATMALAACGGGSKGAAELAPMTQRRLSRTLDLPQPFGPTTPVRPDSMCTSAGSTNDLKPTSRRRWNCIALEDHRRSSGSMAADRASSEWS